MTDNTSVHSSDLHNAIRDLGITEIYGVALDQIPKTMLQMFLEYGIQRKRSDGVNGKIKEAREETTKAKGKNPTATYESVHGMSAEAFKENALQAWNVRMLAGEISSGKRGSRIDWFEKGKRSIMLGKLGDLKKKEEFKALGGVEQAGVKAAKAADGGDQLEHLFWSVSLKCAGMPNGREGIEAMIEKFADAAEETFEAEGERLEKLEREKKNIPAEATKSLDDLMEF